MKNKKTILERSVVFFAIMHYLLLDKVATELNLVLTDHILLVVGAIVLLTVGSYTVTKLGVELFCKKGDEGGKK